MQMRMLPLLVLPLILACAFVCPAPAGEKEGSIPIYSDRKGDRAWIEMDRADGRMQATPYLRVSGETVHQATQAAGRAGDARESAAGELRRPDPMVGTARKNKGTEALASLLNGPRGVSLGAVLDLARQASESARQGSRQVRAGNTALSRETGAR